MASRCCRGTRLNCARAGNRGNAGRRWRSAEREKARSLGKQAHWPKSAKVPTSLRLKLADGPGRGGSIGRYPWSKSSIITYSVVKKVSVSISDELLPQWNGGKLPVWDGYLPFKS